MAQKAMDSDGARPTYSFHGIKVERWENGDIEDILKSKIAKEDHAFVIGDLNVPRQRLETLKEHFPGVKIYYAVKSNPNKVLMQFLADHGVGMECASECEIEMAESLGLRDDEVIVMNPVKPPHHIRAARRLGTSLLCFDNEYELVKLKEDHPDCRLLIRVETDDKLSPDEMGYKFGCPLDECEDLLKKAQELKLNVVGTCFHVGSGGADKKAWIDSLKRSHKVWGMAEKLGMQFSVVNIGGGMPGDRYKGTPIEELGDAVMPVLHELFPNASMYTMEPGRYFSEPTFTEACRIFGKRFMKGGLLSQKKAIYYQDDGIYGFFSGTVYETKSQVKHTPTIFREQRNRTQYNSVVFGPTCDGSDHIVENVTLPELMPGEWVYYPNIGAYSEATRTHFNGFFVDHFYWVDTGNRKIEVSRGGA